VRGKQMSQLLQYDVREMTSGEFRLLLVKQIGRKNVNPERLAAAGNLTSHVREAIRAAMSFSRVEKLVAISCRQAASLHLLRFTRARNRPGP
jgi:hypothetical protein